MERASGFIEFLELNTLPRRQLLGKRYNVLATLGRGSFGEVLLVEDRVVTGARAVVKRFRKREEKETKGNLAEQQMQVAVTEARVMSRFNDDGIVRLLDTWYEDSQGVVCYLMEYCSGGDLEAYLQQHYPLSEEMLRYLFLQCLLALAHIHTKGVIHRDLKLTNILLGTGSSRIPTLKVADFGLSAFCSVNGAMNVSMLVGTPLFMSPETITEGFCGYGSDVWSLGVVFYRMMTNFQPFLGADIVTLRMSITDLEPPHPAGKSQVRYSQELGDLVMSMLTKQPLSRPSVRQLICSPVFSDALLECPWRSKPLRGALCLFACHKDYTVSVFAEPRLDAKIVGTFHFGDHVFVSHEVHSKSTSRRCSFSRSVGRRLALKSPATAKDHLPDVTTWCRIVGPLQGYCLKYERGQSVLRHVGDCTPCGPLFTETVVSDERGSSPEPKYQTVTPSPQSLCSSICEGTRRKKKRNVLSSLFKHRG
ncbi:protein kinase, putative [Trypanosoma cruzi marinkellei]|uniref:non-specific serine/threonine protein kinase n=1 Tax=Trypanosoma cruzi marinkellei TaxID=85056 RepID=K2N2Y3_TRYCR|nr:protein kinase, putative [Trypanosoma cruzi marinkellei]